MSEHHHDHDHDHDHGDHGYGGYGGHGGHDDHGHAHYEVDEQAALLRAWKLAGIACQLLAMSLRYPDAQLAHLVYAGEWMDAAQELADACGWQLPADFDEPVTTDDLGDFAQDERELLAWLRAEADRLFAGPGEPLAAPYESSWFRPDDDEAPALQFANARTLEVERFLWECGLSLPEGSGVPADAAPTELELLQYLAQWAAGAAPDAPVEAADLPGGAPDAAFSLFMDEHAQAWLPQFAQLVLQEAELPFYRAVAALLAAFLDDFA